MPQRERIPADEVRMAGFGLWNKQWLVLTAGDFASRRFNAMTVSWGGLGYMWNKPLAIVVVRPQRYTFEFMERYETYTLCALGASYRKALELLGSKSGRDGDKIAEAGLTPIGSAAVAAPGYAEAELIIECRKMYWQDLEPKHFLREFIPGMYSATGDFHRVYWGEVLGVSGTAAYRGNGQGA